jgi:hypothetical protein
MPMCRVRSALRALVGPSARRPPTPTSSTMSSHFAKPENALRKGQDLLKVGKPSTALKTLHNILVARRYRLWTITHEHIMVRTRHHARAREGERMHEAETQRQVCTASVHTHRALPRMRYGR